MATIIDWDQRERDEEIRAKEAKKKYMREYMRENRHKYVEVAYKRGQYKHKDDV